MKISFIITFFVLSTIIATPSTTFAETFKLGIPVSSSNNIVAALGEIYTEAFERFGQTAEIVSCSPSYCASFVRDGRLDGEGARHAKYGELYPHVERIEFVLFKLTSVAITKREVSNISNLNEFKLRNYKVAYQIGYRGYEKRLSRLLNRDKFVSVAHWKEGILKVKNDQVDTFLAVKQILLSENSMSDFPQIKIHDLQDFVIDIHPFVSGKLLPYKAELLSSLNKMREKRRVTQIFRKHAVPIDALL